MKTRDLVVAPAYALALALGAAATDTWRAPLPVAVRERFGVAPIDLRTGEFWRVLSCPLLTHGSFVFWGSLVIASLSIGWAERRFGAIVAVGTFLASHVGALLAVSLLVVLPMELAGSATGAELALTRDVGGSGGYYGCLGLAVAGLSSPAWRRRVHVAMALIFLGRLVGSIWIEAHHTTLHGDLAHPIAYGIGVVIASTRASRPLEYPNDHEQQHSTDRRHSNATDQAPSTGVK